MGLCSGQKSSPLATKLCYPLIQLGHQHLLFLSKYCLSPRFCHFALLFAKSSFLILYRYPCFSFMERKAVFASERVKFICRFQGGSWRPRIKWEDMKSFGKTLWSGNMKMTLSSSIFPSMRCLRIVDLMKTRKKNIHEPKNEKCKSGFVVSFLTTNMFCVLRTMNEVVG